MTVDDHVLIEFTIEAEVGGVGEAGDGAVPVGCALWGWVLVELCCAGWLLSNSLGRRSEYLRCGAALPPGCWRRACTTARW